MIFRKILILFLFWAGCFADPIQEELRESGYAEISVTDYSEASFFSLYKAFDLFIDFLQANLDSAQKLNIAKERFIRSQDRGVYSTDFFGLYDESKRIGRRQIAFYYSSHFHNFISRYYPELNQVNEINDFLEQCFEIQVPYRILCDELVKQLDMKINCSAEDFLPPLLLKVIKYLPEYNPTRPHYDGSFISLFLHTTDRQSLLLSPYKSQFSVEDFLPPKRESLGSIFIIPGVFLVKYGIYPTPHIVAQTGRVRYSTVAFAMKPSDLPVQLELTPLPNF